MKFGIGGHHGVGRTVHWLTPPRILKALGPFDLDPCACPEPRPWPTAEEMWSHGGHLRRWHGFVWCNPPYGRDIGVWMNRVATYDGPALALTFARTETQWFHRYVWKKALAVFFFEGRINFHLPPDGERSGKNAGGPSCVAAYGEQALQRLEKLSEAHPGITVDLT